MWPFHSAITTPCLVGGVDPNFSRDFVDNTVMSPSMAFECVDPPRMSDVGSFCSTPRDAVKFFSVVVDVETVLLVALVFPAVFVLPPGFGFWS